MRAAVLALVFAVAGTPAVAQAVLMPGAPPVGPEVTAAFEKVRRGDPSELMRLAEAGGAEAQTYAGLLLAFTGRTPAERQRGCDWLEAASGTRPDAMHALGEAFQYGRCGGAADIARAIKTFHKAGDMGMAKSRCAEGNLLIQQRRDLPRAVELCRQGAEAGDADAQTDLGNIYLQGDIVPKDAAAAAGWYRRAVDQGHRNAAYTLGQMHWYGDGVAKDVAASERLWKLAYEKGRRDAAVLLGDAAFLRAFPDGPGGGTTKVVWEPLNEALDWYARGADHVDATKRAEVERRVKLLKEMKAQIDAGQAKPAP